VLYKLQLYGDSAQRDLLPTDLRFYQRITDIPTDIFYRINYHFKFFFNRTVTTTSLVIEFASNLVSLVFETIDTALCIVLYGVDSVQFSKRLFWIFRRKTIDILYTYTYVHGICRGSPLNTLLPVKCQL